MNTGQTQHNHYFTIGLSLIAPLLLHLFLTLQQWSVHALWLDEAYGVVLSRVPPAELPAYLRVDSGPPLLYGFFHILRWFFAESVAMYRVHALVAGVAGLIVIWRVAWLWRGPWMAGYAAMLWAVSPLIVHYEREARVYTLLALCCLIQLWILMRWIHGHRSWGDALAIALSLCAALYGHNFGWFLVPAAWLAFVLLRLENPPWKLLLLGQGIAFVLYIPWLPIVFSQLRETERTIGWIRYFADWKTPLQTFWAFVPGGRFEPYAGGPSAPYGWIFILAQVVVVMALGMLVWSKSIVQDKCVIAIAIVGGVLVLGPLVASVVFQPMALPGRTDVIAYPCFVLLVAAGLSESPEKKIVPLAMLMGMALCGTMTIWTYTHEPPQRNDAFLAESIRKNYQPGDVVLFTGLARPSLESYLFMNRERDMPCLSWPMDMEIRLAHLNEREYLESPGWPESDLTALDERLKSMLVPGGRLLVVSIPALRVNQPLSAYLQQLQRLQPLNPHPLPLRRLGQPVTVEVYEWNGK